MKHSLIATLCVLSIACVAFVLADERSVTRVAPSHFFTGSQSHDWIKRRRASSHDDVSLVFAIRQKKVDLQSMLYEIANPRSSMYGKYLTPEQLHDLVADVEAHSQVYDWLRINGAKKIHTTLAKEFITATFPVVVAERLLAAEFYDFTAPKLNHRLIRRTPWYSLPVHIAQFVDFVGHTISFPPIVSRVFQHKKSAANSVDPQFLFQYYNISNPVTTNENSTQSVYENLQQSYNPDDLSYFQQQYNLEVNPISKVIGPNDPSACTKDPNNCIEATLDVEYLMAVAQNASTTFWSIADEDEPFLDWINAIAADPNPPFVHSVSYGSIEDQTDADTMQRFDTELVKQGLRGLTVIVASGDDGVANFIARSDKSKCGFHPSYPATSPHVTALGATMGPEMGQDETACTSTLGGGITTGGGFSGQFDRPSYQDDVVNAYLNSGVKLPPKSDYHGSGRGYPDAGTLGHNYNVYINNQDSLGSGTSASAPVFAGMVTLMNDARFNMGKSPLGFLNVALYQLAGTDTFRDITEGENNCCAGDEGSAVCCRYGFYATQGWDPLTGLGGIVFPNLFQKLVYDTP
eukprot:TRINITY_DN4357_c0_g1_i1.p1 TRINITY_DN4357_c0_g1~~TRINITY_DN4357_c0_g1_i1.p1  ORF type:complete len:576 (+),score=123.19 TRINITY_DN4357_c0_g1_i1:2207-3934(+)